MRVFFIAIKCLSQMGKFPIALLFIVCINILKYKLFLNFNSTF